MRCALTLRVKEGQAPSRRWWAETSLRECTATGRGVECTLGHNGVAEGGPVHGSQSQRQSQERLLISIRSLVPAPLLHHVTTTRVGLAGGE